MKNTFTTSADTIITHIHKLFSRDLAMENDFLRQENSILRGKLGKRVPLPDKERRVLLKYGLRIRERLGEVISIVKPETFLAWHRRMKKKKWTYDNTPKRQGRPYKEKQTEELIIKIAEENGWGYRRIAGEFKKLGHNVCPNTVGNILKR